MKAITQNILIVIIACMLTGCFFRDMDDLEEQISEILARPGAEIEPLPEIKPYEVYVYKSMDGGAADPFEPFYVKQQKRIAEEQDAGLTAEMEHEIKIRNREELESYELDSLRMVGTIDSVGEKWGIIRSPDKMVYRVKVGNYMGSNIGKVIDISEDKIELREIFKNSQGRWEERIAAISLTE